MSIFSHQGFRSSAVYLFLTLFCCLPIWSVEMYLNQDGSPHLYNGYIMLQLLEKNPVFSGIYALNPVPIPNISGHWLLALLLYVFSPFVVTKIFVTFCFAAFVAAVGWLRFQTVGRDGLTTAYILAAALSFNWMWFLGFYNFIVGTIGFTFGLGFFWRWREKMNLARCFTLSLLIIFVYLSHLISFGMLIGSIFVLTVFVARQYLRRTIIWTVISCLPVLPLIISYKMASQAGGGLVPSWRYVKNPLSPTNWILQIQSADPFQLLSRKSFPFVGFDSLFFVVFSPLFWLTAAFICLSLATVYSLRKSESFSKKTTPFAIITFFSILVWLFAPDDFGKSHGSFLRERVLLCGLVCFVPLFKIDKSSRFSVAAWISLAFILVFQTTVLWEYSFTADKIGREYLSGKTSVGDQESMASVVLIEGGCRYKSDPLTNLNVIYGIGKNTRIWDNYELGYYLFPVVAQNSSDRQFIYNFRESNAFALCDQNENVSEKLMNLNSALDSYHDQIDVMLVWGEDARIEAMLKQWFEDQPFYQNNRVRLYRHR